MSKLQIISTTVLLLLLALSSLGDNPPMNSNVAEANEPALAGIDCLSIRWASKDDIAAPFVSIIINADDSFAVAASRPTGDSFLVEFEEIPASESGRLSEEIASATNGTNVRIFVVAAVGSRNQSLITVLFTLTKLKLCDVSIIVDSD